MSQFPNMGMVAGAPISGVHTQEALDKDISTILEQCPELMPQKDILEKALLNMMPKHRELVREALLEYQRKGNFVRVYPARGSDLYD